ncbi:MAG: 8-oxo-dGTP diphosphatase [Candidatus Woesebacteria bacterium]|jgi:8-oxo-dGTP pyrophosphatase MutT (NUDIX family)
MTIQQYKTTIDYPVTQCTLCYLLDEDRVLLAKKKRGLGKGNWSGVGGKIEAGETIEAAAIRESIEEISVTPLKIKKVASLGFYFPYVAEPVKWSQEVHAFISHQWQGEPQETAEMAPQWFNIQKIPFDKMWSDTKHWLPKVLAGESLKANFIFDKKLKVKEVEIKTFDFILRAKAELGGTAGILT